MYKPLTIFFLLTCFVVSCKKEKLPEPFPNQGGDDRNAVLLKDVVEGHLPSPYFHFAYNDSGYVTEISFADGLVHYDVAYSNKRVTSLVNRIDHSKLEYSYSHDKVTRIRKSNDDKILWTYVLSYNSNHLKEVKWYRHQPGDSVLERKVIFSYGNDGNLSNYEDYWRNNNDELKLSRRFVFSHYDEGRNVDDFYLFKNFFEDLLFLPGVKLQKNNPGLVQILGEQNDYEIEYSYAYQNGLPVKKDGKFRQTRGNEDNMELKLTTSFSYY